MPLERSADLRIEVIQSRDLIPEVRDAILELCSRAYERDLASYYEHLPEPTHIAASVGRDIVSHALWVTRWLQVSDAAPLRTAYVELVATEPAWQGMGFASRVMEALAEAVRDFDLAALCPDDRAVSLYQRLGWRFWEGSLSIRDGNELLPTPGARIMFLPLPLTPPLDTGMPLSAEWRLDDLW